MSKPPRMTAQAARISKAIVDGREKASGNGADAAPAVPLMLTETVALITRSMLARPEQWKVVPKGLALHAVNKDKGIAVVEIGAQTGAERITYRVAVVIGEGTETTFDIRPEFHRAARDALYAAMTPWREQTQSAAMTTLIARLKADLDGIDAAKKETEDRALSEIADRLSE